MMRILIAIFFGLLALPALAQELAGTITTAGDTWFITTDSGHSKSRWSGDGTTVIVTLFGHASDDTVKTSQGALTIQFYLFEPMGAQFVNEVDIVYYKDETKGAYVTLGHGAGSIISLQQVVLSGNTMKINGDFNVTLLFTDDFGVTLNETNSIKFTGHFDAVLTHD